MSTDTSSETKVVTGKVRINFPHLFEAHTNFEDQEPKFSCMILIPKTDKLTIKALREAEKAATEEATQNKWGGKTPRNLHSIIKDADEDGTAEDYPEREGCLYFTASSKTAPHVVDKRVNPILDQSEVYSGVYAKVSLRAYGYSVGRNKAGVTYGLNGVQVVAHGEPLGGRSRAEDDFSEMDEDDDFEDDDLLD